MASLTALIAAVSATHCVMAAESTNTSGTAPANGAGNPAVTISLSGSTAMRGFTTSPSITLLTPGTSITLNNGTGGAPVTYTAPGSTGTSFQLASSDFTVAETAQNYSALRLEWHEQGSVEGILDLANDQIGYISTPLVDLVGRNPNIGNPIWVNRNAQPKGYTAPGNVGGLPIAASDYNTYSAATYNSSGKNLQGGMNRVQLAISDVNAKQGFSVGGTSAAGVARVNTPGLIGFGKGNNGRGLALSTLTTTGPATAGGYYQLTDQSALNMETTKVDPRTGANYTAGAWNTAGTDNLQNTAVGVTATLFVANPGTGLDKLNRTDTQFLQTTGRLQNGATFNFASRDVGSGTRNVAALNTGVDPSFAVGTNDDGNGNNLTAGSTAQDQVNIGAAMRFSNKTAGGGQLRPVVENNRMSVGTLSMGDAISVTKNTVATPIRALAYSDTLDGSSTYVAASASNIVSGAYVIWQNETYVTVKAPNAAFAADTAAQWAARTDAETGIKGDNAGSNVAAFRANITGSVSAFPNQSSISNPADGLLSKSFILPQMMSKTKQFDGVGTATDNPNVDTTLQGEFLGSSYAGNFNPAAAGSVTKGTGGVYGQGGNNTVSFNGAINITNQNYLFGNFNQIGTRDFAALKTAQTAQAALVAAGAGTSAFSGLPNSTVIVTGIPALDNMTNQQGGTGVTKGDLIVMGDLNGSGKFDGKSLYQFATGAALADSATVATLTPTGTETLGDAIRRGVLVKNAALDYLQTNATLQQKTDAAVTSSANPAFTTALAQQNAFNKFDVARNGVIDLMSAAVVDKFVGQDPSNIDHQLNATITASASNSANIVNSAAGVQQPINLYQVKLTDGSGPITHATNAAGISDFKLVHDYLNRNTGNGTNAVLLDGDTTFKGSVGLSDYNTLAGNYKKTGQKWSQGDFTFDGQVTLADYNALAANYKKTASPAGGNGAVVTSAARTLTSKPSAAEPAVTPAFVDPGTGKVALEADPSTGKIYIVGHDSKIVSYEVDSASGKLTNSSGRGSTPGYNTLASQSQAGIAGSSLGNNEPFWNVISQATGLFVSEGVTLGQTLSYDQIGAGLKAFDLNVAGSSAWTAGTPVSDLTFSYGDGSGTFSPAAISLVPEPTTLSLLGLGALGLLSRRRKSK
jgi:hypothetical protein